jgi:uncharacterized protein YjbJ (UPF0337 family)
VTASGTSKIEVAARDAVTLSGGSAWARVLSCAAAVSGTAIAVDAARNSRARLIPIGHIHCLERGHENGLHFSRGSDIMADDLGTDGLKNQAKGAAKEAQGKVRNAAGGISGDTSEQVKGKAKEMEGKAQRNVGEAQDRIDRNT